MFTRAILRKHNAFFVVEILKRIGIDCWKPMKTKKFADQEIAIAYAKTYKDYLI